MSRKVQFIINPVAGGRANTTLKSLERHLPLPGCRVDFIETKQAGDGYEQARLATVRGADLIVACGGRHCE